jgi:hypothetical protein
MPSGQLRSFRVKEAPEAAALLEVTHLSSAGSITASERPKRISLCHLPTQNFVARRLPDRTSFRHNAFRQATNRRDSLNSLSGRAFVL